MKPFIAIFLAVIFIFGCTQKTDFEKEEVIVTRVIDGDTVKLFDGESVRLIGIDSTEKGERCFEEAKEKLTALVEGKGVLLEKDAEERDKYGRLLGYLYIDEIFVNLEMVESGNAFAFEFAPNTKYAQTFAAAQEQAKEQKIGCLWGS